MNKKLPEHPYITKNMRICAGEPIIRGTRIPVRIIFQHYEMGKSIEGIKRDFPSISLAQISDALSFCFDHNKEIRKLIKENLEAFCPKKLNKKSFVHY